MYNIEKSALNFSKLKGAAPVIDYQIELTAIWSDHTDADNFGIYEHSVIYGLDSDCKCCMRSPSESTKPQKATDHTNPTSSQRKRLVLFSSNMINSSRTF